MSFFLSGTITPAGVAQVDRYMQLYSPRVYLGFSIIKYLDKYWSIDIQADACYQKFLRSDQSFGGRSGAYFWQFRNSVIPNLNIGDKWRVGIGLNFDYLRTNHMYFNLIRNRAEFGGIMQLGYRLNEHFNLHLNYRHSLKAVDFKSPANRDPLQSLNLGLGYLIGIKK